MSRIMVTYAQGDTPTPRKKWHIKRHDAVKLLIPTEFGGGAIHGIYSKDRYREYPEVTTASGEKYDALELLAYWNDPALQRMVIDRHLSTPEDVATRPADPAIDIIEEESSYFYISLPDGEVVVPPSTATEVISAAGMKLAYNSEKKCDQQNTLRYQMCIVPAESDLTYEECAYYSGITVDTSDTDWITCVEGKVRDTMQDERATSGLYLITPIGITQPKPSPPTQYSEAARLLEIYQEHNREVSEARVVTKLVYDPWEDMMDDYGKPLATDFPPLS
jgi:hypothetical protein